jgi:hypothetical protein
VIEYTNKGTEAASAAKAIRFKRDLYCGLDSCLERKRIVANTSCPLFCV